MLPLRKCAALKQGRRASRLKVQPALLPERQVRNWQLGVNSRLTHDSACTCATLCLSWSVTEQTLLGGCGCSLGTWSTPAPAKQGVLSSSAAAPPAMPPAHLLLVWSRCAVCE